MREWAVFKTDPFLRALITNGAKMKGTFKIVLLDFDRTLIDDSSALILGRKLGIEREVFEILRSKKPEYEKCREIASILSGLTTSDIEKLLSGVKLESDVISFVKKIKERKAIVGLISEAYDFVIRSIVQDLPLDFIRSPSLETKKGILTGKVKINENKLRTEWCIECPLCKRVALREILASHNLSLTEVIAIGDGVPDACLFIDVGFSIAVNPSAEIAAKKAHLVTNRDFNKIGDIVTHLLENVDEKSSTLSRFTL